MDEQRMKRESGLNRLLDRKAIAALLDRCAPLLGPNLSLGLVDAHGRRLGGQLEPDETELARLWERVRDHGAFVAPARGVAAWPITVANQALGMLLATGELPASLEAVASLLVLALESLAAEAAAKRAIAQETLNGYREINVLYRIGETLGTCLDLDQACHLVLDESIRLTDSRRGAVLLVHPGPAQAPLAAENLALAAAVDPDGLLDATLQHALPVAIEVAQSAKPQIVNDFQPAGLPPIPLVCAPLRFQQDVLGVILLAEKASGGDFAAADEKLLFALATQAASSIENARLFESVREQRDEIAAMKNYMENIFASVASGVITTDMQDVVTTFNQAAEAILDLPAQAVLDRPYQQALAFLNDTPLSALISEVGQKGQTYIDYEISPYLPTRGQVHLNMSLSRLQGSSPEPLGVTIVVDDVTEKKQFEQERRLVRRYLPPELVDALPSLEELKLRGERQVITTLFADIRGFTTFAEAHAPETVLEVINRYFGLAAEAVRAHHGIVDKYLGDAVMAVFNTPLLATEDHAWDAVRAAWELREAINRFHDGLKHDELAPEMRMSFGMGICTGEAVVGNVGTTDRMEYTAIGDSVNVAKRLQECSAAGQIVMSHSTWECVQDRVRVKRLSPVKLKGRRTPTEWFELVALSV
jgi:adenylate cyclase